MPWMMSSSVIMTCTGHGGVQRQLPHKQLDSIDSARGSFLCHYTEGGNGSGLNLPDRVSPASGRADVHKPHAQYIPSNQLGEATLTM